MQSTPFERVQVLNCRIDNLSMRELLHEFRAGLLVTPNIDHIMTLQTDREFYEIYRKADYVVADGQVLVNALRYLLGTPVKERVSGSDFFPAFCRHHRADLDISIFLMGGPAGTAEAARDRINTAVGRRIIVDACSPSMGFEKDEAECAALVRRINTSSASVLAVGVGAPKQEKWIERHRAQLDHVRMFMGIGATIEFEAGYRRRAPPWVSRIGMEWLFRLAQNPADLAGRYLVRDMRFFALALKQSLGRYRDPFQ